MKGESERQRARCVIDMSLRCMIQLDQMVSKKFSLMLKLFM